MLDDALNQLAKRMTRSGGETLVFIRSPTGTALPESSARKCPHTFLEGIFGQSLTMSFLKGYSKLKVLASILA